jgi:hypothetical protein
MLRSGKGIPAYPRFAPWTGGTFLVARIEDCDDNLSRLSLIADKLFQDPEYSRPPHQRHTTTGRFSLSNACMPAGLLPKKDEEKTARMRSGRIPNRAYRKMTDRTEHAGIEYRGRSEKELLERITELVLDFAFQRIWRGRSLTADEVIERDRFRRQSGCQSPAVYSRVPIHIRAHRLFSPAGHAARISGRLFPTKNVCLVCQVKSFCLQ